MQNYDEDLYSENFKQGFNSKEFGLTNILDNNAVPIIKKGKDEELNCWIYFGLLFRLISRD